VDGFDKQSVQFGIENFGWHGHHDNCLFIGFRCPNGKVELFADTQDNMVVCNRNSRHRAWANTTYFDKDPEKFGSGSSRIRFTDPELVAEIYADEQQFESLLLIVMKQACTYIDDHLPALMNYLENIHQPS